MKTENEIPEKNKEKELSMQKNYKRSKIGFGIFIVAIGAILLTNEIHPNLFHTRFIWPVIIILIGLKWIFKPYHSKKHCCHNYKC